MACLALTISEGMIRGTGVIPHANIVLILTTLVLCFFPAGDAFTLPGKRPRTPRSPALYRGALVAVALVFSLTYVFAGARRLSESGAEVYFDDTILTATVVLSSELSPSGGLGVRATESPAAAWALRIGFPIVTLFEWLTLLCLISTRFRWLWLAVMLPFHVGTGFLMGIWFWYNLALAPVVMGALPLYRR